MSKVRVLHGPPLHEIRPVARIGRAADSKSAGWGFESLLACHFCGCSSMVEPQPSKLITWVRFPSPAPIGALAQLGERLLCTQEVSGSIPLSSTMHHLILGSRQVGKARDFGSRMRRFESCLPSHYFLRHRKRLRIFCCPGKG